MTELSRGKHWSWVDNPRPQKYRACCRRRWTASGFWKEAGLHRTAIGVETRPRAEAVTRLRRYNANVIDLKYINHLPQMRASRNNVPKLFVLQDSMQHRGSRYEYLR